MEIWELAAVQHNWTPLDTDDSEMVDMLEPCAITGHYYPADYVTITYEGAILSSLWGNVPIEFDAQGRGIMPPHLIELFKVIAGREPDLD